MGILVINSSKSTGFLWIISVAAYRRIAYRLWRQQIILCLVSWCKISYLICNS